MSSIQEPLTRLFNKHRIVFWYDAEREFRRDFERIELDGIEKMEVANNEFTVKHRILRDASQTKFLLYFESQEPEKLNNWLLDVQLAYTVFRTDQASMHLGDLGLGPEFAGLVQEHLDFFKAAPRKEALKAILKERDGDSVIRIKMLAICVASEPRIDVILENLLEELAAGKEDKIKLIQRAGLEAFLWNQVAKLYGYHSETSSVRDFAIELFKSCYGRETGQASSMGSEAVIFLKRWKDSIRHKESFEQISKECAEILGAKQDLEKRDYATLMDMDYFQLVDMKIISDLVRAVNERTISAGECAMVVRNRRQSHWYTELQHFYEAVEYGSCFLYELEQVELQIDSFSNGIQKYCSTWFRLDQLYRKYIYHEKQAGSPTLLAKLTTQIEELYTNNYLLKVNDRWQNQVDSCGAWQSPLIPLQNTFFVKWVEPFCSQNKKIYVIISDAFRYEIGEELFRQIRSEDRYDATLEPMVSLLPSYTQLGMAALLPNSQISLSGGDSISVLADGNPTIGTYNRGKVLAGRVTGGGTAIKADEFLDMGRDDCRELMRENSVLYIYHNRIDATGDKRETEGRVFEAVEETLKELTKIIKKLAGNNATNMIVTSDHGFIYQDKTLDESDFSSAEVRGAAIYHQDRRFILGRGLEEHSSLCHFAADQLGLGGDVELQVSKSINRMRLKGSGSRFVHGGASLQEIVIPVVRINKKRKSDVSAVDVDIIRSGSAVITSGQVSVAFYQTEPVTGKVLARTLRSGIYTKEGELISDSHELVFDFTSGEARERERKIRFLLNRNADTVNGQTVILKLEEKIAGTSQYKEYRTVSYTVQRSFTSDFDF